MMLFERIYLKACLYENFVDFIAIPYRVRHEAYSWESFCEKVSDFNLYLMGVGVAILSKISLPSWEALQ